MCRTTLPVSLSIRRSFQVLSQNDTKPLLAAAAAAAATALWYCDLFTAVAAAIPDISILD